MSLTDTAIRNTKPQAKPVKMVDGDGLYLLLNPSGSKWWRLDYRIDGKRKTLSMGVYPDVPLKLARQRRQEARTLLALGVDPGVQRKAEKQARADVGSNTFEVLAREWMATRGYDPEFGARPLRRLIQNEIEDSLSDGILSGKFHIASLVRITVGEDGELLLEDMPEAQPEPTE